MTDGRKNCPMRHENGNCMSVGGFCLAVNDGICEGLRNAYKAGFLANMGKNNWHTGIPTEEGLYAIYYWDDHNPSATPYPHLYDGFVSPDGEGNWINSDGEVAFIDDDIVRWQKFEPYKETE